MSESQVDEGSKDDQRGGTERFLILASAFHLPLWRHRDLDRHYRERCTTAPACRDRQRKLGLLIIHEVAYRENLGTE